MQFRGLSPARLARVRPNVFPMRGSRFYGYFNPKPELHFEQVTRKYLKHLGIVTNGKLQFDYEVVNKLAKQLEEGPANVKIEDLFKRLRRISKSVKMNNKGSFGMTVDQILLTLSDIASSRHQGRVLIFPHTEVSGLKSKDCKLEHWDPVSEARLQLFGPLQVDYTVMQSFDVHVEDRYHQDVPTALNSGILNRIFFVDLAPNGSYRLMPSKITAAVSKAIVLLRILKHPEIRFCVTTGLWWCFFVVKTKHGKLSYHFSTDDLQRELRLDPYRGIEDFMSLEDRLQRLRQLMVLVSEWLNPQTPGLYIRSTAK